MAYVRKPEVVLQQLVKNSGNQVICKSGCKIQVPMRFKDKNLAEVGIRTFVYGFFPIILSTGEYAVVNVNSKIELAPSSTITTMVDGVEYYEFNFLPNSVLFKNTFVLKDESMMFNVFDEFVFLGKIPWYAEYNDIGKLFDTAKKYGGSNVAQTPEVIEFIASMVGRRKDDKTKYLRTTVNSYDETKSARVAYVPLKSVYYSVNSTLNKIAGSYMSAGIDSAIVAPSTNVEKIESILRA